MNSRINQNGHTLLVIVIIIVALGIVGALGYVLYQNHFAQKNEPTANTEMESIPPFCAEGENLSSTGGTFCSEEYGIKFRLPDLFKDKTGEGPKYEITEGPLDYEKQTPAGKAELVYGAEFDAHGSTYALTIAKEPLRSGYTGVGHLLQTAYYDADKNLLVTGAASNSENVSVDELDEVPSQIIDGVKVYRGIIGDAGTQIVTYAFAARNKLYKIELINSIELGPDDAADHDAISEVVNQFDERIKTLTILQ